jgi:hypothetical protein
MRDVLVWLLFVLLGAIVFDLSREELRADAPSATEQVLALS